MQRYLVDDPAAEGVPPAAFAGIINRAEQARLAATHRTAGAQDAGCQRPGSINAATEPDAAAAFSTAQSDGCTARHDGGNGLPPAAPAVLVTHSPASGAVPQAPPAPAQHDAEQRQHPAHPGGASAPQQQSAAPGQRDSDPWAPYRFPDAELAARGIVLDIASPQSPVVNCFTKSYGSYSKVAPAVLL